MRVCVCIRVERKGKGENPPNRPSLIWQRRTEEQEGVTSTYGLVITILSKSLTDMET